MLFRPQEQLARALVCRTAIVPQEKNGSKECVPVQLPSTILRTGMPLQNLFQESRLIL